MSLLHRLFRTRTPAPAAAPGPPSSVCEATPTSTSPRPRPSPSVPDPPADSDSCSYFAFNEHQVRVLLFRECDWKGRKILYDSSAIEKVPLKNGSEASKRKTSIHSCYVKSSDNSEDKQSQPSIIEISEGFAFHYKSNKQDCNVLGEMIFGSVAMNHKGMSLKFHILNDPKRLMCTKVFHASNGRKFRRRVIDNRSARNSISSTTTDSNFCDSVSVDSSSIHIKNSFPKPESTAKSFGLSYDGTYHSEDYLSVNWNLHKEDSGYCGDYSSNSSVNSTNESLPSIWNRNVPFENSHDLLYFENTPSRKNSSSNCLQRRFHRYISTKLEKNSSQSVPKSDLLVTMRNEDHNLGYSSIPSTSESLSSSSGIVSTRNNKMAVAIIVTLSKNNEIEMFDFLMEHALLLENALRRLRLAVQKACGEPHLFITNMSKATDETAQWFKDILTGPRLNLPLWTNLKFSTDLKTTDPVADLFLRDLCLLLKIMDTKDTYFFMSTLITNVLTYHLGWVNFVSPYNKPVKSKELKDLNIRRPYNPLWAQLGDLYGAIGSPARISKTVIYGKENASLVNKIVFVLSYFIRCSEMKKMIFTSTPISWESVDLCLTNFNSVNKSFKCCDAIDSTKNSDSIEMKTFSFKDLSFCVKGNESSDTLKSSLIFNKNTVNTDKELTEIQESKFIISSQIIGNPLSSIKYNKNVELSSLNSTTTTESIKSNESVEIKNKCEINNEKSDFNVDKIKNKVNTLCRVPTSALLYHMQTSIPEKINIDDKISYDDDETDNIKIKISKNTFINPLKIECEKQQKSSIFSDEVVEPSETKKNGVIFTLGDDELLLGLKKIDKKEEPSSKVIKEKPTNEIITSAVEIKTDVLSNKNNVDPESLHVCRKCHCKHSKYKKHSGVKFDFDKYPQIVTNYMKSKNLEILDRHVIGKPGNLKIDSFEFDTPPIIQPFEEDCEKCCSIYGQMLQTPSNASELEYTNDMPDQRDISESKKYVLPAIVEPAEAKDTIQKNFVRKKLENTVIVEPSNINMEKQEMKTSQNECDNEKSKQEEIILPLSFEQDICNIDNKEKAGYNQSLLGSVTDHYISDLVLQGTVCPGKEWEYRIKRDLSLQNRNASGGAICVLADIDDWSVKIYSSNGSMLGGMSALVATMLDSLPHMCHANVPTRQCLAYIESKLRELCIRSKTLAELLMDTEFCDMEHLTKTLDLDPNDVPLLLAIASTHSPQVSLKYGISFR